MHAELEQLQATLADNSEAKVRAYCAAHKNARAIIIPIPAAGAPRPVRIGFETK